MAKHVSIPLIQRVDAHEVTIKINEVMIGEVACLRLRVGRGHRRALQSSEQVTRIRISSRHRPRVCWPLAQRFAHQPKQIVTAFDLTRHRIVASVAKVTAARSTFHAYIATDMIVARTSPGIVRQWAIDHRAPCIRTRRGEINHRAFTQQHVA